MFASGPIAAFVDCTRDGHARDATQRELDIYVALHNISGVPVVSLLI
jgi:hypothetical protein